MTHEPRTGPFVSHQRVFFDLFDALGMLHNVNYFLLFERARGDFWRANNLHLDASNPDWPYYVVHNEITYRAPIFEEQIVSVTVGARVLGRTSLTFAHSVTMEDGTVSAEGATVIVRVNAVTKRPVAWSDGFRTMMEQYVSVEL